MSPIEKRLGFRVTAINSNTRGSVQHLNPDDSVRAVRPATPAEIEMWLLLNQYELHFGGGMEWLDAHSVSDPFGTPKSEERQ